MADIAFNPELSQAATTVARISECNRLSGSRSQPGSFVECAMLANRHHLENAVGPVGEDHCLISVPPGNARRVARVALRLFVREQYHSENFRPQSLARQGT